MTPEKQGQIFFIVCNTQFAMSFGTTMHFSASPVLWVKTLSEYESIPVNLWAMFPKLFNGISFVGYTLNCT